MHRKVHSPILRQEFHRKRWGGGGEYVITFIITVCLFVVVYWLWLHLKRTWYHLNPHHAGKGSRQVTNKIYIHKVSTWSHLLVDLEGAACIRERGEEKESFPPLLLENAHLITCSALFIMWVECENKHGLKRHWLKDVADWAHRIAVNTESNVYRGNGIRYK